MERGRLNNNFLIYLVVTACFFSIIVFFLVARYINAKSEAYQGQLDEFYSLASTSIKTMEQNVTTKINALYALRDTIRVYDDELTLERFSELSRRIRKRTTGIGALEFVPKIMREERGGFEQRIRNEGIEGYTIKEIALGGILLNSRDKDVYFPILYIEPLDKALLGFDAISHPQHRNYVRKALKTRRPVIRTRVELVEAQGRYDGLLIMLTETDTDDPIQRDNMIAAVLNMNDFVASTFSDSIKENLEIYVFDLMDQEDTTPLYSLNQKEALKKRYELESLKNRKYPFQIVKFNVADRNWIIYLSPRNAIEPLTNQFYIWSWTIVFLFTLFFMVFMIFLHMNKFTKAFESNLYHLNLKFQAIIENTLDGIVTVDSSGLVQSFNKSAGKIFGYRAEEVLGKDIQMLIKNFPQYISTPDDGVIRTEQEVHGITRSGREVPLRLGITDVNALNQHLYIAILQDVSEKKRMDKMKDNFMSTVNHELRTPLTSIHGGVKLLEKLHKDSLSSDAQKLLRIIESNTDRIISLVNDILDIQKIESGELRLEFSPVDLAEIITESIQEIRIYAQEYDVVINSAIPDHQVLVEGNAGRLSQVMNNLLSNAIKFSSRGETVEVIVNVKKDKKIACVRVIDHGIGISENFRHKLFQRFTREDSTVTSRTQGSGLGLNISKAIVEQHNGAIGVESKKGKGSEFFFELPLLDD